MPWREQVTVDEKVVFEGPATDVLEILVQNYDPDDGVLWDGWTWSGQVRSEDGLTLIGTFTCDDDGTTATALSLSCTLELEVSAALEPGLKYIGGIKGTKTGQPDTTWVEMEIYPQIPPVQ